MEPNHDLYQKTFSRLKASPELKEKLLAVTEQAEKPKKFILRRALVLAAVAALLFALAMGASAAIGGDLFMFSPGNLERVIPMDGGMAAYIYRSGEKVSVIVQKAPVQPTVVQVTSQESIPVNPTPDPNGQTIIRLGPSEGGENGEPKVRLISITVVSPVEEKYTQVYTPSSEESENETNRIVYGNTLSIVVKTDEGDKDATLKIVDNSTQITPARDGDGYQAAFVKIEHEGGDDLADDEEQSRTEAEAN